jgi:DNA polymerase-3 subunit epsilon
MPLRPIFYDTETTGIRPDRDRVIEIAAYDPTQNRTFEMLVNPGLPIPPEATAIHKITNEMVSQAPAFDVIGSMFVEFCGEDVVLIAHNNDSFDLMFLQSEFKRHSITFPSWKFFDTLKWARRYRPDLPRHSLQFLREIYGIEANNAHRALDDVIVLHQVYSGLVGDLHIEHVHDLLNQAPQKAPVAMPFGKHQGTPLEKVPKDYIQWMHRSGAFDKPENNMLKAAFQELGFLEPVAT